jgi:probable F420-dependent oxidoreductase
MKFGVSIGNFGQFGKRGSAQNLVQVAQRAEELGYDSVWVHDHIFMPARIRARYPYNESGVAGFAWRQDIYDPLAMMAAVAVRTGRVSIGTSVLVIPYRNPLVLAKMLATLDCLSHGRIVLGTGVGWMAEEFEALGMGDYYPVRGRVTDEWMRICIEMWTSEGPSSYEGRYHSFRGVGAFPKPVQKPHIPIWVGGKGEVAARRVARYGSGYHTITSTPQEVAQELQIVQRELEKGGRDLSEIEVSMLGGISLREGAAWGASTFIGGSKQQIIDHLGEYKEAGLHHLIGTPSSSQPTSQSPQRLMEDMQYLAEEIIPALR